MGRPKYIGTASFELTAHPGKSNGPLLKTSHEHALTYKQQREIEDKLTRKEYKKSSQKI